MKHLITRAEIDQATVEGLPWFATSDHGGEYRVIANTEAGIIVRGENTGVIARVVQTGTKVYSRSRVRVRIEFCEDTGDVAGTLAWYPHNTRVGGFAVDNAFLPSTWSTMF